MPGGELLLASVAVHGATATPVSAWYGRAAAVSSLDEERESTAAGLFGHLSGDVPRVTLAELHNMLSQPDPPTVADVRTRPSHERDGAQIPGSVRLLPDQVVEWAAECAEGERVISYCS